MEWVETIAKTVDEAKSLALDELGVDEADAEFDIVEEPKPGLFGRMRGEARVRARVLPSKPRPKVERRRRRDGDDKSARPDAGAKAGADAVDKADKPAKKAARGTVAVGAGASVGDVPARNGSSTSAGRPRAKAAAGPTERQDAPSERPTRSARREEKPMSPTDFPTSDLDDGSVVDEGAAASQFLAGLAAALGVEATTTIVTHGPDDLEVRLDGADLGLLIGPRGQTLGSVQELTRLAVQRNGERRGWLRIDIGGYREKRREALIRFTEQVVADVTTTGTPRALEPMSSADRKIVHDAATSLGGVRTSSEGEDPHRRVVISPLGDA